MMMKIIVLFCSAAIAAAPGTVTVNTEVTITVEDAPPSDPPCTDGDEWDEDCNHCHCDNGWGVCTEIGCPTEGLKQLGEDCGSCYCPPTYDAGTCAQGLKCVHDPRIADAPGRCVRDDVPGDRMDCLVGDIMYVEGDNVGYIGLTCHEDGKSFLAEESRCENGKVRGERKEMTCPDEVPYCCQSGQAGEWGAATCLSAIEACTPWKGRECGDDPWDCGDEQACVNGRCIDCTIDRDCNWMGPGFVCINGGRCEQKVCRLPPETGDCKAAIRQYYFDPLEGCKEFIYGGCGGNGNNFSTKKGCEEECGFNVEAECYGTKYNPLTHACIGGGEGGGAINEPDGVVAVAICNGVQYDPLTHACTPEGEVVGEERVGEKDLGREACLLTGKDYGVGSIAGRGTIRNINSKEQCQRECAKEKECNFFTWLSTNTSCYLKTVAKEYGDLEDREGAVSGPKVCVPEVPDVAMGQASNLCICTREYAPVCVEGKTYSTLCTAECALQKKNPPHEIGECKYMCCLEKETGPCEAAMPRYYYDKEAAMCLEFMYGGCEGNQNNFETMEACEEECGADGYYYSSGRKEFGYCTQECRTEFSSRQKQEDFVFYYEPGESGSAGCDTDTYELANCLAACNTHHTPERQNDEIKMAKEREEEKQLCEDYSRLCPSLDCDTFFNLLFFSQAPTKLGVLGIINIMLILFT